MNEWDQAISILPSDSDSLSSRMLICELWGLRADSEEVEGEEGGQTPAGGAQGSQFKQSFLWASFQCQSSVLTKQPSGQNSASLMDSAPGELVPFISYIVFLTIASAASFGKHGFKDMTLDFFF